MTHDCFVIGYCYHDSRVNHSRPRFFQTKWKGKVSIYLFCLLRLEHVLVEKREEGVSTIQKSWGSTKFKNGKGTAVYLHQLLNLLFETKKELDFCVNSTGTR